ncbi:MAG: DNA-binding protein [Pseudomonadota bacterium]
MVKIGSLLAQPADQAEVRRLLEAARRSLADARRRDLSPESRFDLGYKAIMHCAIAALRSKGYRLSTSRPGHHQTAVQSLALTLDVPPPRIAALDALRRKRNGIDYEADVVSEAMADGCVDAAGALLTLLASRLGDA